MTNGNNDICVSIQCHSRAMTRESRSHECRFAESGRSMVEMLGTLAIMGVLSIGGIMGYSYAVDRYHANQIMNDVNLRGIDLIAQASRGGGLSLAEWPTKTSADYDIGLEIDTATNTTEGGIYVKGVQKRICEMIADDLLPEDVELVIDGETYVSGTCGETNKMVFYYDAVAETLGGGNQACVETEKGCVPCPSGATLSADKTTCECAGEAVWNSVDNVCQSPCSEGQFVGKNETFKITVQIADLTFDTAAQKGELICSLIGRDTVSVEEWYDHFSIMYTIYFTSGTLGASTLSSVDEIKEKYLSEINNLCVQHFAETDYSGVRGSAADGKEFFIGQLKSKNTAAGYGKVISEHYSCTENEDGSINFDYDLGGLPLPF